MRVRVAVTNSTLLQCHTHTQSSFAVSFKRWFISYGFFFIQLSVYFEMTGCRWHSVLCISLLPADLQWIRHCTSVLLPISPPIISEPFYCDLRKSYRYRDESAPGTTASYGIWKWKTSVYLDGSLLVVLFIARRYFRRAGARCLQQAQHQ